MVDIAVREPSEEPQLQLHCPPFVPEVPVVGIPMPPESSCKLPPTVVQCILLKCGNTHGRLAMSVTSSEEKQSLCGGSAWSEMHCVFPQVLGMSLSVSLTWQRRLFVSMDVTSRLVDGLSLCQRASYQNGNQCQVNNRSHTKQYTSSLLHIMYDN